MDLPAGGHSGRYQSHMVPSVLMKVIVHFSVGFDCSWVKLVEFPDWLVDTYLHSYVCSILLSLLKICK